MPSIASDRFALFSTFETVPGREAQMPRQDFQSHLVLVAIVFPFHHGSSSCLCKQCESLRLAGSKFDGISAPGCQTTNYLAGEAGTVSARAICLLEFMDLSGATKSKPIPNSGIPNSGNCIDMTNRLPSLTT